MLGGLCVGIPEKQTNFKSWEVGPQEKIINAQNVEPKMWPRLKMQYIHPWFFSRLCGAAEGSSAADAEAKRREDRPKKHSFSIKKQSFPQKT